MAEGPIKASGARSCFVAMDWIVVAGKVGKGEDFSLRERTPYRERLAHCYHPTLVQGGHETKCATVTQVNY